MNKQPADLILHNGKIATQDDRRSLAEATGPHNFARRVDCPRFAVAGADRAV